jgi:hypothetical protein
MKKSASLGGTQMPFDPTSATNILDLDQLLNRSSLGDPNGFAALLSEPGSAIT